MKPGKKIYRYCFNPLCTLLLIAVFIVNPCTIWAQVQIEGKVIEDNTSPVPFASVKLTSQNRVSVTDGEGHFVLRLQSLKNTDTIIISSVGYENLILPAASALKKHEFILKAFTKKMETVTVRSFTREDVAGAKSDIVGYYRSWNTGNTGAEIGRAITVGHDEYQVTRVRFKIFTSCDTCVIRLHIREFNDGQPGDELLTKNVEQTFIHAAVADKTYDFDLSKYNLILSEEQIFVSFEVLDGSTTSGKPCAFSFTGSEQGSYIYKKSENGYWITTNDYAIHLKVFFRYDE